MDETETQVWIERSGGFAGIVRTARVSDPDLVTRLLAAIPAPGRSPVQAPPDRFVYRIEIVRTGSTGPSEAREFDERALPPEARTLLAELLRGT